MFQLYFHPTRLQQCRIYHTAKGQAHRYSQVYSLFHDYYHLCLVQKYCNYIQNYKRVRWKYNQNKKDESVYWSQMGKAMSSFFLCSLFFRWANVVVFFVFFSIFLIFRLSTEVSIPLDRKDKKTAVKLILDGQISVTPPFFRLIFCSNYVFTPLVWSNVEYTIPYYIQNYIRVRWKYNQNKKWVGLLELDGQSNVVFFFFVLFFLHKLFPPSYMLPFWSDRLRFAPFWSSNLATVQWPRLSWPCHETSLP